MKKWFKNPFHVVRILAFVGMLVTAYLILQHYESPADSFCNINDYVNCDIVNKSKYAEIFGIPVAIVGFGTYTIFFISTFFQKKNLLKLLLLLSVGGLIFSLYLTFIEFFVLKAICIFCITQQIVIFLIFLIFLKVWLQNRKSSV